MALTNLEADACVPTTEPHLVRLGRGTKGLRGVIVGVGNVSASPVNENAIELERRLLEVGFVEGATIEILHEGFIGNDPIAVRVDDMRVALRRREADAILVNVSQMATARRDRGK